MNSLLNRSYLLRLVQAAVLAVVLSAAGFASPASAAVPGLQRFLNPSITNSDTPKTATVSCPAGQKVVSAGATINGEYGKIVLTAVDPSADLTSVTAKASETGAGTISNWNVAAYAVCANDTAALGLQLFPQQTLAASTPTQSITTFCPAGKKLVGVGGAVNRNDGTLGLYQFQPNSGLTSVNVGGAELGSGTTANWIVTAEAICANASAVPDLERVALTKSGSSFRIGATPLCPAGKQAVGGAGAIDGPTNVVALFSVLPTDDVLSRFNATAAETGSGTTDIWSITAYAFCVTA